MSPDTETLLTTAQVAAALGISYRRVLALINSGRLRATRLGRDYFIEPGDLESVRARKPGYPRGRKRATSQEDAMSPYTISVERTAEALAYPDNASIRPVDIARWVGVVRDAGGAELYRSPLCMEPAHARAEATEWLAAYQDRR